MKNNSRTAVPFGKYTFRLSREHAALHRLQRWVAVNGAFKLTLQQAAEIAALEPHYFSAAFHRHVGQSFLEWRRKYRAKVAVHLINNGDFSISYIVTLVGYRDRLSLERAIAALTGRTAAYFKQHSSCARRFASRWNGITVDVAKIQRVHTSG